MAQETPSESKESEGWKTKVILALIGGLIGGSGVGATLTAKWSDKGSCHLTLGHAFRGLFNSYDRDGIDIDGALVGPGCVRFESGGDFALEINEPPYNGGGNLKSSDYANSYVSFGARQRLKNKSAVSLHYVGWKD